MEPKQKIAAGYVRCSTDEQGATSIPQQQEEIKKWSALNHFNIVKWFIDEGRSGTDFLKRPAFKTLVDEIQHDPDFEYVLVYDESRWGRAPNPRESNYWKMHFERYGVKVRVIHSSSKNEDDIGSYVVEVVESAEASEYSKKLSRSVRRGMLSPQQGKYSRGGTAPYGYKRVAIDCVSGQRKELRDGMHCVPRQEKVVWELGNPVEVETVKRIFEMKTSGMGCVAIADRLNSEHIPCPKRGRWKNRDKKWSGCCIETIIRNQTYTGDRVYNKLSYSKYVSKEKGVDFQLRMMNDPSEWIIVPDAHPPIISKELFAIVTREKGTTGSKITRHHYRSNYLLTGLVKCTHCNFSYQGAHHNKSGNKYYVDGGFINKGKSVCNYHSVRKDVLEEFVLKSIKDFLLAPEMLKKINDSLLQLLEGNPGEREQRRSILMLRLKENEEKIGNLITLVEKGMQLDSVTDRIKALEEEKQKLKDDLSQLDANQLSSISPAAVAREVLAFFARFEENFDKVPILEKKDLIRRIVEKILVDPVNRKVECYLRQMPNIPVVEEFNSSAGKPFWVPPVAPTGIEPVFQP